MQKTIPLTIIAPLNLDSKNAMLTCGKLVLPAYSENPMQLNNFTIKLLCALLLALTTTTLPTDLPYGNDILLIINYNFPYYASIPVLQEIYSPWFPNIVFYGPKPCPGVHLMRHHEGWYTYLTIADAMQRYPTFNGYLQIHDDCIINCWNFTRFNKSKIWFIDSPSNAQLTKQSLAGWEWWTQKVGYTAAQQFYDLLPQQYKNMLTRNCGANSISWGYSDIVYFPKHYAPDVIALCQLAKKSNLFLEIALPTICSCLAQKSDWEMVQGIALWENKDQITKKYTREIDFAHPIKLSSKENVDFVKRQYGY